MNKILQGIAAAQLRSITDDATWPMAGTYRFSTDFAGFAGHFPGHPILPAIVEIMTVVALVSDRTGCRQRLVAVEDAKFLNPVNPDQELVVRCRPRMVKGKLHYEAQLTVGETTTATVLLELAPCGEWS